MTRAWRASYRRTSGVRHMIAAMDLATGKITYRIRARKRWQEFPSLLKLLRQDWPGQKLYVILDNFSPHKHAQVTEIKKAVVTAASGGRSGKILIVPQG